MELTVENILDTLPTQDGFIYCELFQCVIDPENFITRFEGAQLTYQSLYAHPNATAGWKQQFDAWKDQSIFN